METKIRGLALKVYDPASSCETRSDYWDKKMQGIYFSNPALFKRIISLTGIYSAVSSYLPCEGLILDGGCGSNYMAHIFDTPRRKIVGLDFAVNNLVDGKKVYPDVLSVAGDLNSLPFADCSFDAVLSNSTAEHLESGPGKLLFETHRVLREGGIFLLIIPTYNLEDWVYSLLHKFKRDQKDGLWDIPHLEGDKLAKPVNQIALEDQKGFFAYWFNKRTLKNMLRQSGFKIERSFSLDVLGGMMRSRFFGRQIKKYVEKTIISILNDPREKDQGFLIETFIKEDIPKRKLRYFIHEMTGFFYKYTLAFVCRK